MPTDAYERIQVQGHTLNKRTYAAFLTAQARGRNGDNDWTITQGSYNSSVPQSGGTHDGGGALDLTPFNWENRVHALRAVGFAAWHRLPSEGDWPEHIHAELINDREASSGARAQWADYLATPPRNGLANHLPDPTWHPNPPVVFDYPAYVREQKRLAARRERARLARQKAIDQLQVARTNTDDKREKARLTRIIEQLRSNT